MIRILFAALLVHLPSALTAPTGDQLAPYYPAHKANVVEGSYIVKLKTVTDSQVTDQIQDHLRTIGFDVKTIELPLLDYAAELTEEQFQAVRQSPDVEFVEDEAIYDFDDMPEEDTDRRQNDFVPEDDSASSPGLQTHAVDRKVGWGLQYLS